MILRLLAVALGGAFGAVARHVTTGWVTRRFAESTFPYGTLVVNVAGSFVLGVLLGLVAADRLALGEASRALWVVGFLGAFTTFSTFSYQTLAALRTGAAHAAFANVAASVLLGVGACWLGWLVAFRT